MAGSERSATITGAAESDVVVTREEFNKLIDDLEALRAAFHQHTHKADGSQAGAYNTSRPTGLAETLAAGADERAVPAADLAAGKVNGF